MTTDELVRLLTARFYENFAESVARQVRDADAVGALYELVTSSAAGLPRNVRHMVFFRGSYVLETIYFDAPESFAPYIESFWGHFPACTDPSAKRHFTKIMAHLLKSHTPVPELLERIAESAAQWAIEPRAKVAVKIGAVEVLKCCREKVAWVAESWDDMLCAMEQDATPGIRCRMRKSWRPSKANGLYAQAGACEGLLER